MVLPVNETNSPVWLEWKGWLKWLASASAVFAGIWWLVSRDATGTLIAAAVPWGIALGGLLITVLWGITIDRSRTYIISYTPDYVMNKLNAAAQHFTWITSNANRTRGNDDKKCCGATTP